MDDRDLDLDSMAFE